MKQRLLVICLSVILLLLSGCRAPASNPDLQEPMFRAAVVERTGDSVTVVPLKGEDEYTGGNSRITFSVADLKVPSFGIGTVIDIAYNGMIMESYPAQIHADAVAIVTERLDRPYEGEWLDEETTEPYYETQTESDLIITAIYTDCFFARSVVPLPYAYKINGKLSDEWCVGDQVLVTHTNNRFDKQFHIELDMTAIDVSEYVLDPNTCAKPVIYLYPEEETAVDVVLTLDGELTCTYPAYKDGWRVSAAPDGTLTDANGQTYNYLYWEGDTDTAFDMSSGFCIKGEDTAAFLETALADLGLTRREANEFIVYWLPLMEQNPYNVIAFQTDAYTDAAKLDISPAPDTLIRVFMAWQASDTFAELPPQTLTAPDRIGFTRGGSQLRRQERRERVMGASWRRMTLARASYARRGDAATTPYMKQGFLQLLPSGSWGFLPHFTCSNIPNE